MEEDTLERAKEASRLWFQERAPHSDERAVPSSLQGDPRV